MEALDPKTFKLRRYEVEVGRWGTSTVLATTRGKAMADAWRSDAFNGYSFGAFLKMARCRLSSYQPTPVQIEVSGEQVWGLGHNGQYVIFVPANGEFVFSAHPLDVLPTSARPIAYQPKEPPMTNTDCAHGGDAI